MKQLKNNDKSISDDIGFSEYSVQCDEFDVEYFDDIKEKNPSIATTCEEGTKEYSQFPQLHQDLFSALFRYAPELLDERKLKKESLLNREIIKTIMDSDKYKELRNLTRLDKVNSTIGTEVMGNEVSDLLDKLKEQRKALDNLSAAQDQVNKAKSDKGKSSDGDGTGIPGEAEEHLTLKEAQAKLKEAQKEFKKSTSKRELKSAVHNMMDSAIETTTDTSKTISNWGLDSDNTFTKMSYHEKIKLIKSLYSPQQTWFKIFQVS